MSDLPPCPFCQSSTAPAAQRDPYTDAHSVLCDREEGGCGARTGFYDFADQALQAWSCDIKCNNNERNYG